MGVADMVAHHLVVASTTHKNVDCGVGVVVTWLRVSCAAEQKRPDVNEGKTGQE